MTKCAYYYEIIQTYIKTNFISSVISNIYFEAFAYLNIAFFANKMKCIPEIKILGPLIALLQVSALTAKEVNKEIQVPLEGDFPDSSTRCGDVLQASSGTISYKSFTPVSPNKRCVWTVRNPKATGYEIAVDNLGKSSSVIISAISVGSISMQTFIP